MTYKNRKQLRLLQNQATNTLEQEVVSDKTTDVDSVSSYEIPQWKMEIESILAESSEITKAKEYKEFITTRLQELLK